MRRPRADLGRQAVTSRRVSISSVTLLLFGVSRVVGEGALYRHRYRRWRRQMGAARQEAVLVSRVGDQDRRAVRGCVAVLTLHRLDLIGSDVLGLSSFRHGDAIFRVVAVTQTRGIVRHSSFIKERTETPTGTGRAAQQRDRLSRAAKSRRHRAKIRVENLDQSALDRSAIRKGAIRRAR